MENETWRDGKKGKEQNGSCDEERIEERKEFKNVRRKEDEVEEVKRVREDGRT